MKNLKIAMISYHTCPLASLEGKETGGMNVYVLELSRALTRRGHKVDMFTRCQAPDNPQIVAIEPGLRNIHLPAGTLGTVPKREMSRFYADFVREVTGFVRKEKRVYDILHSHYYMSGIIGLELLKLFNRRPLLVMNFHTLGLLKNLVATGIHDQEDAVRIKAEHELMRRADRIIAVSDPDRDYMNYLYGAATGKITVIPPGVDLTLFAAVNRQKARQHIGLDSLGKLVLFVGRVERLKGIELILYAFKILIAKNPAMRVCLLIVGGDASESPESWSGPLKSLEELRRTLGIAAIVKFVGGKKQTELPYYYNSADVVVMPSHYESFGMVALEAMACGVPVITTDVAGVSAILDEKHRSLVTTVNNPFLLADRMENLLLDDAYRSRESGELRKHVKDLSWSEVVKQVETVYEISG